jgi:hypothetical protein
MTIIFVFSNGANIADLAPTTTLVIPYLIAHQFISLSF